MSTEIEDNPAVLLSVGNRTRLRRIWESLTFPVGDMEPDASASAQMLASALLSMMLVGVFVSFLDVVTAPPRDIYTRLGGGAITLALLFIPYVIARTAAYRFAFYLAIILYDLTAVMSYALNQQAYFLSYFLIPILLGAMFSSRRMLLFIIASHLAFAILLAVLVAEESVFDIIQEGMLPLFFISALTFTWSQFNRDHVDDLRKQMVRQERLSQRDKVALERQFAQQAAAFEDEKAAMQNALDEQIAASHEQSLGFAKQIILAREEERRRSMGNLHTEANQALTTLALNLAAIREAFAQEPGLPAQQGSTKGPSLEKAFRQISGTMARLQLLEDELRPDQLTEVDLTVNLEQLCTRSSAATDLPITFTGQAPPEIDSITQILLYRCLQEALANVARHASATQVDVHIETRGQGILLSVQDNGRGYDAALALQDSSGLTVLRESIEDLAGRLVVVSQPDAGTLLRAWLPLTEQPPADFPASPIVPPDTEQALSGAIRVLIADNQQAVGHAVSLWLDREDSFDVIGFVSDEQTLMSALDEAAPDIVVIDPQIGRSPAQLLMSIQSHHPTVKLLVFTADNENAATLLGADIKGYVLKDDRPESLSESLRAVALGRTWWSPRLTAGLSRSPDADSTALEKLTRRETEVLQLMVDGLSNDEIARTLTVSVQTVRNHARLVYKKLGVSSRVEVVLEAMRLGVQPSSGEISNGRE